MKKRELLYVHALLMAVAETYTERGELRPDALAEYHELGVTPMSIQTSRTDHERAVLELSSVLDRETPDPGASAATDERPVTAE